MTETVKNENKIYMISVYEVANPNLGYYGHIVMDEKIHPKILDEILTFDLSSDPSYDSTLVNTHWTWGEVTQEEYEFELDLPLPPLPSVMLADGVRSNYEPRDYFTKKLKNYLDSTTPQQRKEVGVLFENVMSSPTVSINNWPLDDLRTAIRESNEY